MSLLIIFTIGILTGLAFTIFANNRAWLPIFVGAIIGIVGAIVGGIYVARAVGGRGYNPDMFSIERAAWTGGGAVLFLLAAKTLIRLVTVRRGEANTPQSSFTRRGGGRM
jgi:uncharacterized membrane protein YeaQ/YmgE (transglycosylase-associated protein family)